MNISICNALIGLKILILATVGLQIRLSNACYYRLVFHFAKYGKRLAQPFLYVLRFIFPHLPILLMLMQQPNKAVTLVVGQTLQGLQLADEPDLSISVH